VTKEQPTRPVEDGVDPSNERMVLDHLKNVAKGKKPTAPEAGVGKRVRSRPMPRRYGFARARKREHT
jgi:hypothetical protein